MPKTLNLGCGKDIIKDAINLDNHKSEGVDVIWDLNILPLPFADGEFDVIYCSHVLEDFINPVPLLDDIVRITKPQGTIKIIVPNETWTWHSIFHQRPFNANAFKSYARDRTNYGYKKKVVIKSLKYTTNPRKERFLSRISWDVSTFFANLFGATIMSNTFVKHLFPMTDITVEFEKYGD